MIPPVQPSRAPIGDPPTIFPRSTAVAVLDATRYVRSLRRNTPPPRRTRGDDGEGGLLFARNTGGAIASGGSGTVTVYKADGTTLSSRTVTAHLYLSGTVAVNVKIYIGNVAGKWHIVSADCP